MGYGAPLAEEAVLANSGRAGEVAAWVGQVRSLNFSSILPGVLPLPQTRGPLNVHRTTIVFPQPASAATVRPSEIITMVNCPSTRHTNDGDLSSRQPHVCAL